MGLFDFNPTFLEKYEGGLPDIKAGKDVKIVFNGNQLTISTLDIFYKTTMTFTPEQILEVGLNQQNFRSAGKAAGGAIIGGLLTGGIGLLAGAALGGKRRTENNLHFVVAYNGREYDVHFKPSKTTQKLYSELVTFSSKAPKQTLQQGTGQPKSEKIDVAAELEKLHGLVQKGILTQEEFEIQKQKLLS